MIVRTSPNRPATAGRVASLAQAGLVLGIGLLALAPPERGAMLLIPLTASAADRMDDLVARSSTAVTGIGLLPRSRFVEGERGQLLAQMLPQGILVLAGAPPFCGRLEGTSGR